MTAFVYLLLLSWSFQIVYNFLIAYYKVLYEPHSVLHSEITKLNCINSKFDKEN